MKKQLLSIVIVLHFLGILFSCSAQTNNSNKVTTISNQTSDTVIKDIPLDKAGRPRSYYRNKEGVEEKLGLTTLERGFDSLQIRLWYGYAFNDSSQLVVLKNINGNWNGELYTLVYHFNEKGDSIKAISKEVVNRKPKSGWETLTKKLFDFNILTLPDYHTIPEYDQVADGDAVIVEVSSKKRYKIYSYQEPHMFQDKHWQARNMEQILELIEDEFSFKRLRKL